MQIIGRHNEDANSENIILDDAPKKERERQSKTKCKRKGKTGTPQAVVASFCFPAFSFALLE